GQLKTLPVNEVLDALSVRLNGPKAGRRELSINLEVTDTGERFLVSLENATMRHEPGKRRDDADLTLAIARMDFIELVITEKTLEELEAAGAVQLKGEEAALRDLLSFLDTFDFWFEIVMP